MLSPSPSSTCQHLLQEGSKAVLAPSAVPTAPAPTSSEEAFPAAVGLEQVASQACKLGLQLFQQIATSSTAERLEAMTAADCKAIGNSCFVSAHYAEARLWYSAGLSKAPGDCSLLCNRAAAALRLADSVAALADCQELLLSDPDDEASTTVKAWFRQGQAMAGLRAYSAAAASLEQAVQLQTRQTGSHSADSGGGSSKAAGTKAKASPEVLQLLGSSWGASVGK